ncbi:MAG: 3-hydroxyacyl-CoA dehydrogenase family protein [Armatimonadetes bacterium]|nr:MAG: 3-hydroxyacyl-CoA dehydrogenase family protein [Armatimonadota bacterium]
MRVVVIGGGTMGIGIGHRFAAHGGFVELVDVDLATAEAAVAKIGATLDSAETRGKIASAADAKDRIVAIGSIDEATHHPDAAIEAVIENVDLKRTILQSAERLEPTVLGSNTSSLSIDSLAEGLQQPTRFVGLHFFNPVWAIPLIEVIKGEATSSDTLASVTEIVEFLDMEQAVINDAPGFATSRLGVLVGLEAIRMVEQGVASPADIDRAMSLGYRHPMGPLMLGDLVGLDVRLGIAKHLATVYGERFEPPELLKTMVAEGKLGKKSGMGFYDWSSGSAVPIEEP